MSAELRGVLRAAADPLVVDLGYGASPVTTVEMANRLRTVRPDVDVVGVEIALERVRAAQPFAADGLTFAQGGFELGPVRGRRPVLVRAFNVLRQYDEDEAAAAWDELRGRIAPGGVIVEGTCDEVGRLATWVRLDAEGPRTLTLAAHLPSLDRPSRLAERLPKSLIHHNVPGERVHELLAALDRAWTHAAPSAVFGARQRWLATLEQVAGQWPVESSPARRRLGELTVPWSSVAPG